MTLYNRTKYRYRKNPQIFKITPTLSSSNFMYLHKRKTLLQDLRFMTGKLLHQTEDLCYINLNELFVFDFSMKKLFQIL